MKTKKQVLADNSEFKSLINAVLNALGGMNYIEDVNRSGADAGFCGFTYYSDTHKFAMKHRKQIIELLNYQADQLGEEVVSMVSNFGVFRNPSMDNEDRTNLYQYIGGGRVVAGACTVTNVMAWFALEEVCRMFED